jgi:hypothetical protein
VTDPLVQLWAGFRAHVLIPHDYVGTIIDSLPAWGGLTVEGNTFVRNGKPVLRLDTNVLKTITRCRITALAEVWLQEPALSVKVDRHDGATWRGFGKRNQWTSEPEQLRHETADGVPQAWKSTVHFPRGPKNPDYTVGVEYRFEKLRYRFRSNGGFTDLLDRTYETSVVPWQGCQIGVSGRELKGTVKNTSERPLRRWELAGHPTFDWMHFLGWGGGAGFVVNEKGFTPKPGTKASDEFSFLWDPRSIRKLAPGQWIGQTIAAKQLAAR